MIQQHLTGAIAKLSTYPGTWEERRSVCGVPESQ